MLIATVLPNPPPLTRERFERNGDGFFTSTGLTLTVPRSDFPTDKDLLGELGLPDESIASWAEEDGQWIVRVVPETQFPPHVFLASVYPVPEEILQELLKP